jgi:hypothetical protein
LFLEALGLDQDDLHEIEDIKLEEHALLVLVQYADRASTYLLDKKPMRKVECLVPVGCAPCSLWRSVDLAFHSREHSL